MFVRGSYWYVTEGDSVFDVALGEGGLEFGHVARDHRRVESEIVAADDGVAGAEVTAKSEEGLTEGVAGAFDVAIGPKVEKDVVATNAPLAGDG